MAQGKNKKKDSDGYYHLTPIPGGRFDQFRKKFGGLRLPKDSDKFIYDLIDTYGSDDIVNMMDVDIGQYVYAKGLVHALNMNVGRNIPWIEDGLKSGERRALYIMWTMGLYHGKKEKVASIVGRMIEKVYPHGDQAPADIIFRLGRSFSTMIPYVVNGGDFGNMDTQRPASPRYASGGLTPYAYDCFFSEIGVQSPLYDTKDNYNFSGKEPVFLTSRYPNILMQWNQGIGKGAAAWLGAFNSKDIFKTTIKMLDDPDCNVEIYPDLPIPAQIVNKAQLKHCFDEKEFKVQIRAPYEIIMDKKMEGGKVVDKPIIVFTALPITVIGNVVKEQLAKIKEEDESRSVKRLPEVIDSKPVSKMNTPGGIEFIVEYEKGYDPHVLVEKLYRLTSLSKTVGVQYMLVTDNRTSLFTPRQVIKTWITQRYDQKRRYYHQKALEAAKKRTELEAMHVILSSDDNVDRAVKISRSSKNKEVTIKLFMKEFGLTEFQAKIVLKINLGNLPKMSVSDVEAEREEAIKQYKHYRKILTDEQYIKDAIREELEEGLKKYGKSRVAPLSNLEDKGLEDRKVKKWIVYNNETYYCINNPSDLTSIAAKLDTSYKLLQIENQDNVILVNTKGNIKILDGYSFNTTDQGIAMSAFGLGDIVRIIPASPDHGFDHVAMITTNGYGKIMAYNECIKSTKGKLIVLGEGDKLADIIPISCKNEDTNMIGLVQGDTMYYVRVSDFPKLKRSSTGNHIVKGVKTLNLNSMVYFDMSTTDQMLVYGESGYIKIIDTMYLTFNKRKASSITLNGKAIIGATSLVSGTENKFKFYDNKGSLGIKIVVDKTVQFSTDKGETQKFKMATSIGNPIKVFKKNKTDFYCLL